MPKLIVEVHVPLPPAPEAEQGEYPFPWIDDVEDFIADLDEQTDGAEGYDEGEEYGDVYVFFLTGASEVALLRTASRLVTLDGVPPGSFAVVTDDQAGEVGLGPRVELPLS